MAENSTNPATANHSMADFISTCRTQSFNPDIVLCPRTRFMFKFHPGQQTSIGTVQYKVSPSHGASKHCSRVCCADKAPSKRKRSYPLPAPTLMRAEAETGLGSKAVTSRLSVYLVEHSKLALSLVKAPGSNRACRSPTDVHSVAVLSPSQYQATLDGPDRTLSSEIAFDSSFCPLSERRAGYTWKTTMDESGQITEVEGRCFWQPARNLAEHPPVDTGNSPTDLARTPGRGGDCSGSSSQMQTQWLGTERSGGEGGSSASQVVPPAIIIELDSSTPKASAFASATVGTVDNVGELSRAVSECTVREGLDSDDDEETWLDDQVSNPQTLPSSSMTHLQVPSKLHG
ncbi:hypothetical protein I317_00716 [Kwoniella heveanensis CBS 569]|uniref:Uncharacterized protein n=1 Tax=Kwoniella heveanensis BCC8398 TaxID=1296120 RepID=A0A1B9GZU6_9TREE|nr:hypothetical protein I316_01793 [Kwoniella heveanensis BCC8398]OCF45469.1 hypothetical protein I317_00716 [Kwoniella heveanensis CBS 569]